MIIDVRFQSKQNLSKSLGVYIKIYSQRVKFPMSNSTCVQLKQLVLKYIALLYLVYKISTLKPWFSLNSWFLVYIFIN